MNRFLLEYNQKHQFSENLEIHSFWVLKKNHLALKPYPYLVQFTETNCPQIGKAVKDALLEHHDLLQPLCYFRIEDQIFEGFWSISQLLFIGFGKRV